MFQKAETGLCECVIASLRSLSADSCAPVPFLAAGGLPRRSGVQAGNPIGAGSADSPFEGDPNESLGASLYGRGMSTVTKSSRYSVKDSFVSLAMTGDGRKIACLPDTCPPGHRQVSLEQSRPACSTANFPSFALV